MSTHSSHPTGLAFVAGLVLASSALASTAMAQTSLTWVKDINTTPVTLTTPSYPFPARVPLNLNSQKWVRMGIYFYFVANNGNNGYELFRSDGKTATLVKDIEPGSRGSNPFDLTLVGNKIFFSAMTIGLGRELWMTDGTAAGTKLVKDIRAGRYSSMSSIIFSGNIAAIGNKAVFCANSGLTGIELWVSDGTAAGTVMLKDIRSGIYSSYPSNLTSNQAGNKVYFTANDGSRGSELWITDGSSSGTKLVKDIRTGTLSSSPSSLLRLGAQKVVFTATDGTNGDELWISDGTAAGTTMVKDIYGGSGSGASTSAGVSMGNKVLFRGYTPTTGAEPWITDGTAAGTTLLKDIWNGSSSSSILYSDVDGNKVYWGSASGRSSYEIWMSDGTPGGTKLFSRAKMSLYRPYNIAATGGKVFFCAYNVTANTGYELCMTDGTTTTTVKDIGGGRNSGLSSSRNYIAEIGPGKVAFRANDGSGDELWISQGTAATTKMIDINKPVGPAPTANDNINSIEPLFGRIIFSATDGNDRSKGQHGQELWISDGTSSNTKLLKDIAPGPASGTANRSYPSSLCRLGDYIYFSASDGLSGYELWRTDGTTAGTKLFKNIRTGVSSSYPGGLTRIGDKIFFSANDGSNGTELWVTDGTVAGTKMVKNIQPGYSSSSPAYFARLGRTNKVLFRAYNSTYGNELWISDGTTSGTGLLKDIYVGTRYSSSSPSYLTSYKGKVYFQAYTYNSGAELWVSDGTSAGTKIVKEGGTGRLSGYASAIMVQNGKLYYRAYTAATGYELHSSDGTPANTGLYWDYTAGSKSTSPAYITAVGSRRIYFTEYRSGSYYDKELRFFDVTNKTSMSWNVNAVLGSDPSNYAHGRYEFAVDNGCVYARARRGLSYDYQLMNISNGATAQRIGRAQASSVFAATDPRIGKNMTVSGATGVSNPLSVLCLGVPDGSPFGLSWFASKSYAYFKLTSYFFVAGNFSGATYSVPLSVPNDPGFVGRTAVMQCFALDTVAFPTKTEASNGVHITFGR